MFKDIPARAARGRRPVLRSSREGASTLAALVVLWLGVSIASLGLVHAYALTPGAPAEAAPRWPAQSSLPRSTTQATLVVFAHPECTCTRATLYELATLMARVRDRVQVEFVFLLWDEAPRGSVPSHLLESAMLLPNTRVHFDRNGVEAARFGAKTSGQVFLYGADGALSFEGGLTPRRAEAGTNVGALRIEALLRGEQPHRSTSAVFGCPLDAAEAASFFLSSLRWVQR